MRQERGKTRNLVSSKLRGQELKNTAKKRSRIILFRGSYRGDLQKDCVQVQMYSCNALSRLLPVLLKVLIQRYDLEKRGHSYCPAVSD